MITEAARKKWESARARRGATESWAGGTVGAVARDASGHVAAATSTGGMVNKLAGRVGDSPLIGAGTYADDEAGACSTTGHGEAMIRVCLAKTAVDAHARRAPSPEADRTRSDRAHARAHRADGRPHRRRARRIARPRAHDAHDDLGLGRRDAASRVRLLSLRRATSRSAAPALRSIAS